MSRSGYTDDIDDPLQYGRWVAQVKNTIRSVRGQMFLIELAQDMDAMSEKILIANELIDSNGSCCTIGVICKARGIDVAEIDYDDPHSVASRVGIAHQMVSEIENENDDWRKETPEERWIRMRKWVDSNIKKDNK